MKKNGEDAEHLITEMRTVADRIKELDDETRVVEEQSQLADPIDSEYSA